MSRRRAAAALIAVLLSLAPAPARASTEEFSMFDVVRQEEDDEGVIDHLLTRVPADWRDEWEGSPNAFRTAQGCLTAGQWLTLHELKLRAAMGHRSWLDVQMLQRVDSEAEYEWVQFQFRSPMWSAPGVWGLRFRPSFDKSRHDFAALWDFGNDSSRVQIESALTLEDTFNKLWAFRQTRVGDQAEPYERHPFEPALRVVWRAGDAARPPMSRLAPGADARSLRVDVSGQWLTPGRQRLELPDLTVLERRSLWGAKGEALVEARLGRWAAEARLEDVQALSTRVVPPSEEDSRSFRRRWNAELAASARISARWSAEARWLYRDATETWRPPAGDGSFRSVDRVAMAQVRWRPWREWRAGFGFLRDRITVARRGDVPYEPYATRFETRAIVSLQSRFGRVVVRAVEGIELDREPYEVSFHHDKGFLHLQTTF